MKKIKTMNTWFANYKGHRDFDEFEIICYNKDTGFASDFNEGFEDVPYKKVIFTKGYCVEFFYDDKTFVDVIRAMRDYIY